MGIAFEDGQSRQAIFRAWRDRWGEEDKEDALRVAIITGLSTQNLAEYSVVIGPNLNRLKGSEKKTFVLVSRINRMTPSNSTNLDNFVTAYRSFGRYLLAPAQIGPEPTFFPQLFIAKRNLHIRQAWQIGENDPDVLALQENDNPVIPAVVADPPVTKALTWIRALKRATPHER